MGRGVLHTLCLAALGLAFLASGSSAWAKPPDAGEGLTVQGKPGVRAGVRKPARAVEPDFRRKSRRCMVAAPHSGTWLQSESGGKA